MTREAAPGGGTSRGGPGANGERPGTVSRWIRYGQGMALAFEFVGVIAAGVIAGWFADAHFQTQPALLIVGTIAAVVGGFVRLVEGVRRLERGQGRRSSHRSGSRA